jgi:hypothetical protein
MLKTAYQQGREDALAQFGLQKEAVAPLVAGALAAGARFALPMLARLAAKRFALGAAGRMAGRAVSGAARKALAANARLGWNIPGKSKGIQFFNNWINPVGKGNVLPTGAFAAVEGAASRAPRTTNPLLAPPSHIKMPAPGQLNYE